MKSSLTPEEWTLLTRGDQLEQEAVKLLFQFKCGHIQYAHGYKEIRMAEIKNELIEIYTKLEIDYSLNPLFHEKAE